MNCSSAKTTAAMFGRVALLMGGRSAEREISLLSGHAVYDALQSRGVDVSRFDTSERALCELADFDRAFIALHGRGGEDGEIQGALQAMSVPYTGSGVLGSAIAMDKYRTKLIWRAVGLPTPAFVIIRDEKDLLEAANLRFPVMVKPINEGSSIGMSRVDDASGLREAWNGASSYDGLVLVEEWVGGKEYTGSILGDTVLPLIRLETPHQFYDYAAKYETDSTQYICPCGLPTNHEEALQGLLMRAFHAVNASGWGRVDFLLDENESPWLIEVNTVPGMTGHSLVPMAAKQAGLSFDELVWKLLETSMECHET